VRRQSYGILIMNAYEPVFPEYVLRCPWCGELLLIGPLGRFCPDLQCAEKSQSLFDKTHDMKGVR
jgi:hypothetical protein